MCCFCLILQIALPPLRAQSASPVPEVSSVRQPPFDRLELLAFIMANFDPSYASHTIADRGSSFVPDPKFLSVVESLRNANVVIEAVKELKPREVFALSPQREAGYDALTRAVDKRGGMQYSAEADEEQKAIQFAPKSASLLLAYASNLLMQKKYPEAEIQCRQSLQIWPENADGFTVLATSLIGQNRDSEAVPEAREALKIFPRHKGALVALGMSLTRSKQYAEAIPVLRDGVQHVREMPLLKKDLGVSLYHTGDVDGAIKELDDYLRIVPNDAEAHYYLGVAHRNEGHKDEALAHFREAARIEPSNSIYATVADPAEKSRTAETVSGAQPEDGFLSDNIYTNNFFGFSYEFPRHWTVLPEYMGSAMARRGGAILANGDPILQDIAEASARNGHSLLVVSEGSRKDGIPVTRSVQIRAFDTTGQPDFTSPENKIEVLGEPEEMHIGGTDLWRVNFKTHVDDVVASGAELVTLSRGYVLFFIFVARDQTGLEEIARTIYSAHFIATPK